MALPMTGSNVTFNTLVETLMCVGCEGDGVELGSEIKCRACGGSGIAWEVAELYRAYPIIREALDYLADMPEPCQHDRVVPHEIPLMGMAGVTGASESCPGP